MCSSSIRVQRMPVSSGTSHLYSSKYSTAYHNSGSTYHNSSSRQLPPGGSGPYDEYGHKLKPLGVSPTNYKPRKSTVSLGHLTPPKSDYGKSSYSSYSGLNYPYATTSTNHSGYVPSSSLNTSTSNRLDRRAGGTEHRNTVSSHYGTLPRKSSPVCNGTGSTSTLSRYKSTSMHDISNSSDSAAPTSYSSKKTLENGYHSSSVSSDRYRNSVRTDDVDRLSRNFSKTGVSDRRRSESTSRTLSRRSSREDSNVPSTSYQTKISERDDYDISTKLQSRHSSGNSFAGNLSKYNDGGKIGLSNLGNTCFMNSVIQCLSNTRPLLEYCLENEYDGEINTAKSRMQGALMKAFSKLMASLWKSNEIYVTPHSFKTEIQRYAPRFMGYQQQDSQEFLRYLLEGLHEDVNRIKSKPKPITLEDATLENKSDKEKADLYWNTYLRFDDSKIVVFPSQTISKRLPDSVSVFTAETLAILDALEEIKVLDASKFIIFTDSLSCLQALHNMKLEHPLIGMGDWNNAGANQLHSVKSSYRLSKQDDVVLCRCRIGHTHLTHLFILKKNPPPQYIFVGQLKSELRFDCSHTSVTFDPFWDLSLPLPKHRSQISLLDCLKLFMREEKLDDEERPTCYKCKRRTSCSKGFSIQKFPKILVLHLKRFSQERYSRKVTTSVDFPIHDLDLTEFAAEKGGPRILYNLYAVSNHSGGTHSGHYTAICRHPFKEEWHSYNDTRVSAVRSNQAISSEGYLLFYELSAASSSLHSF